MARDRFSHRLTVKEDGFLLPNHHLPRRSEVAGRQRIEIHTASNRFSLCIPAIPIRRTTPALIDTRRLVPQRQYPNSMIH